MPLVSTTSTADGARFVSAMSLAVIRTSSVLCAAFALSARTSRVESEPGENDGGRQNTHEEQERWRALWGDDSRLCTYEDASTT